MKTPILKCDKRAVACCFWLLYPIGAVVILSAIAKVIGVG